MSAANELEQLGQQVCEEGWTFTTQDNVENAAPGSIDGEWRDGDNLVAKGRLQLDKPKAIIWSLYVEPDYQQGGLMKRIYATLPGWLRDNGYTELVVSGVANPVVEQVNEQAGFGRNDSGQISADISDEPSSVETYGNS